MGGVADAHAVVGQGCVACCESGVGVGVVVVVVREIPVDL